METINIMAIDPGTTFAGVCIYQIDVITLEIVSIQTILVHAGTRFVEAENKSNLTNRLQYIYNSIYKIVEYYQPRILSIENAFYNRLRPMAYGPLSQAIGTMELAALEVNPFLSIYKYAPKTIKKVTTKGGTADKDDMLFGIKGIDEITRHINPQVVSEHEVDAIAVNFTMLSILRENSLILLTL